MSHENSSAETTRTLVSYLYDECDPSERRAIEAHLGNCAACAAEVGALGATRAAARGLDAAASPISGSASCRRPRVRMCCVRSRGGTSRCRRGPRRPLPSSFSAPGLTLGVMAGGDGSTAPPPAAVAQAPAAVAAGARASRGVAAGGLARRFVGARDASACGDVAAADRVGARGVRRGSPAVEAQLLARVRTLIDESEQRQRRELALRTGRGPARRRRAAAVGFRARPARVRAVRGLRPGQSSSVSVRT